MNPHCVKKDSGVHEWIPLFAIFKGNPSMNGLKFHTDYYWCSGCKSIRNNNKIIHEVI